MVDQGIREANRSKKPFTTKADPAAVRASNLVNRSFSGRDPAPRRLEVGAVDDDASRSRRAEHGGVDPSAHHLCGLVCPCDAGSQGEFQWSSQHLEMEMAGGGHSGTTTTIAGEAQVARAQTGRRSTPSVRSLTIELSCD